MGIVPFVRGGVIFGDLPSLLLGLIKFLLTFPFSLRSEVLYLNREVLYPFS